MSSPRKRGPITTECSGEREKTAPASSSNRKLREYGSPLSRGRRGEICAMLQPASLRAQAKQSKQCPRQEKVDCFVGCPPRNDSALLTFLDIGIYSVMSCSRGALSRGVLRAEQDAAPARCGSLPHVREAGVSVRANYVAPPFAAARDGDEGGESRWIRVRPSHPEARSPRPKPPPMARREAKRFPLAGKRNNTLCALRRATSLTVRGNDQSSPRAMRGNEIACANEVAV